jgi:hypothetical protein
MSDKVVDQESQIRLTIAAVDAKEVRSPRQATLLFNIPRSIAGSRLKGRLTHQTAAQNLQRLTLAKEDCIVKAIY